MRKLALAVALALLPVCSGCACCGHLLDLILSTDWSDETAEQRREREYQNAKFQGYEEDRQYMDGKESNAWNPSTLPD